MPANIDPNEFVQFWNTYYRDEIDALAQAYPGESILYVEYMDAFQWDSDIAEDWIDRPEQVSGWFEDTLTDVNTGGVSLTDVTVELVSLPSDMVYSPREIRNEHGDGYVAVRGDGDFSRVVVSEEKNDGGGEASDDEPTPAVRRIDDE